LLTAIYVDFDNVARLVYMHNHDKAFNPELPDDGIQKAYYPSFEHVRDNLDTFMADNARKSTLRTQDLCTSSLSHSASPLKQLMLHQEDHHVWIFQE